jgi:predicted PurR-regulated permease PerM
MLAGRGKLNAKLKDAFPAEGSSKRLGHVLDKIEREIEKYLAFKTIICVVSGFVAWIIMAAFGVDFAGLFGIITFLLNYIPNIGSFIAKILPFIIALLQFDSPWKAVWMLVVLIVTDGIIGMIIEPRMMGKRLGLSPLAILVALFFWGWLWGIPGMILAVHHRHQDRRERPVPQAPRSPAERSRPASDPRSFQRRTFRVRA